MAPPLHPHTPSLSSTLLTEQLPQAEGKTAGGVLLTTESDKPTFGTIAAVGSGKKDEDGKVAAPNVTVGATVMYSKYSGTEFEVRCVLGLNLWSPLRVALQRQAAAGLCS